jgi:phosphonate transport system substrate-binding protein
MSTDPLRFALPPSLGKGRAQDQAERLQVFLDEHRRSGPPIKVYVAESYTSLSLDLLAGQAALGWGPPFVCARVEVHGGRAILQAVRRGSTRYRAGLVCRRTDDVRMSELALLTAAWVDRDSTGGYLLPAAFFKSRGVDVARAFKKTFFVGSYTDAMEAVLQRAADVTAVYASAKDATQPATGLDDLGPGKRGALRIFEYTDETPNDAVLVGPQLQPREADALTEGILAAMESAAGRAIVKDVFNAEGLAKANGDAYKSLHQLVLRLAR